MGGLRQIRIFAAALYAALVASCALLMVEAQAQINPTIVKATFLYRFASFVQWPAPADGPLILCAMAPAQFDAALEALVRDQHIENRPFDVRRVNDERSARHCDVLYLAADEDSVRHMLVAVSDAPVLTVTDADVTPSLRGMIHFVVIDDHVRFLIDDERAARSHLSLDPRLLSLAVSVHRRAG